MLALILLIEIVLLLVNW